jgi:hypothetical protein
MTYLRFGLAIIIVACVDVRGISADDNTIPSRFAFKYGGDPIWISASEAITDSGALRPEVHRPEHLKLLITRWHEQEAFRGSIETQQIAQPCDISFAERFTDGPDEGSITSLAVLEELAATRAVINGRVSASAVGIHDGAPYTILQIDAESMGAFPKRVYLLYPRGRLRFDGMTFCNNSAAYSELPRIENVRPVCCVGIVDLFRNEQLPQRRTYPDGGRPVEQQLWWRRNDPFAELWRLQRL